MLGSRRNARREGNHLWSDVLFKILVTTAVLTAPSSCDSRLHWSLEALWRLETVQRQHESFAPQIYLVFSSGELSEGLLDLIKSLLMPWCLDLSQTMSQ